MNEVTTAGPVSQVSVAVPATSANLGPGFDALGLALARYDHVTVRRTVGGLQVSVVGEGAEVLPLDGRHLVVRALRCAFDRLGGQPAGLAVHCRNSIPQGRGLGSSAAAIVAGVIAARALTGGCGPAQCPNGPPGPAMDDAGVLALGTELEGHPDNVAACLFGGFTLAWGDADGTHAVRLPVAEVTVTALVPPFEASTAAVRCLIPASVPHRDATVNAARAALLVEALGRRPELLFEATVDRLHQSYRAPAMPASAELMAQLRARGIPAVISGAGPTVLVLGPHAVGLAGPAGWRAFALEVDTVGATVTARE